VNQRKLKKTVRQSPQLASEVAFDDRSLPTVIDDLLRRDPKFKKFSRRIKRTQEVLRVAVTEEAYLRYLDVEAEVNGRFSYALAMVAAWAFEQGERRQRPGPKASTRVYAGERGSVRKDTDPRR